MEKVQLKVIIGFDSKNQRKLEEQMSFSNYVYLGGDIVSEVILPIYSKLNSNLHYYEAFIYIEDMIESISCLMNKSHKNYLINVLFVKKIK